MSKSDRIEYVMRHNVVQNASKTNGKLTNSQTLKDYGKHVSDFCEWAKSTLGLKRMGDLAMKGYTPQTLVQKYADTLVARELAATSVHTILAPICKGLGLTMSEIKKPPRLSKDIKKNTKVKQNTAGAKQAADPRNERLIRLVQIVGLRSHALVRLTAKDIRCDENGDYIVAIRDKGGKESMQLLFPHEVAVVRELLATAKDGKPLEPKQRPFSNKDLKQMALSQYRIERAQMVEAHFDRAFNGWIDMPRKTPEQQEQREKARLEAEAEKRKWIEKLVGKYKKHHPKEPEGKVRRFREQLENPSKISIRGGNRERAAKTGRPMEYDRVAVKIASVYCLSHWSDESTIRNYLTK